MLAVSTKTLRKTIEVAGGDAFLGEVSRPNSSSREPKVCKASADLSGILAPPKSLT